ncbi:hypothetical protein HYV31_01640 [candidate division WWE3 bacterium]|nr:hypothetical protein [candidate division WWE3 bacterium]
MSIEHIPNTGQNDNEFPFSYLPSKDTETDEEKIIGKGWESQVKILGHDWVLKEVNPNTSTGEPRSQEMLDFLRNPDRVKKMQSDQNKLETIFGKEHFARSYFVLGKDQHDKEGYMLVQKFIPGKVLGELIGTEYVNTQEMVSKNREQFMDIVWGVKKSFIEFGVPLDFHPGNVIRSDTTGNLIIMDAGFPSEEDEVIKIHLVTKRTQDAFKNSYERLERISRYEKFLQLTPEEKDILDKKYNITDLDYQKRLQDIDKSRLAKGIELDVEEGPVDKLLNNIFGERQEVTGQELYEYALKVLGATPQTEAQKKILEEIKNQGSFFGDRLHWKQIIENLS